MVSNEPIPKNLKQFPIFKNHPDTRATVDSKNWWLWDGQREWRVERLTSEQQQYPYLQVINDTALGEFIESGYREGDFRFGKKSVDPKATDES